MTAMPNDELRCSSARSLNRYYAEVFAGYRDRLEPVAAIPCHTPEEASQNLTMRSVNSDSRPSCSRGNIPRPYDGYGGPGRWIDTSVTTRATTMTRYGAAARSLAWRRLSMRAARGGAPACRPSTTPTTRSATSPPRWRGRAGRSCSEAYRCASRTFVSPSKRVAWRGPGTLLAGIVTHWEKRNINAIQHYNPAKLDMEHLRCLFDDYAATSVADRIDRLAEGLFMLSDPNELPKDVDQFAESLLTGVDDLLDMFANRFFYGCEADDPMNVLAFTRRRS